MRYYEPLHQRYRYLASNDLSKLSPAADHGDYLSDRVLHYDLLHVWLALVVVAGVAVMLLITKKIGGSSARHFIRQQQALGKEEALSRK